MTKLTKLLLIAACCLVLASALLAQQTGKTVRRHREVDPDAALNAQIAQAEEALANKDYPTAEKALQAAVTTDPKNFRAWYDLGFIYSATDRPQQAVDAYRKSVESDPKIFESNLNLGLSLARLHDPQAEKYLRAATQLKPTSRAEEDWARAFMGLGRVLEPTQPLEAVKEYRKAALLQPKDPEPHLAAGMVLERQKDFPAAALEFQTAADLDPTNREALAGLINAYSRSSQIPKAETELRKYLALDPKNAAAHIQLGRALAAQGKDEEAAVELQKGLELAPGDSDAEKELTGLLLKQKKFAEAIPRLRAVVQKNPSDVESRTALGHALMNNRAFPEAQQEFLTALNLKPDMGAVYGDLAIVASENRNYPLTLKALDARGEFLPEVPATYFLRATAFDHLHDSKQAIANYQKFLEVANGKYPDQEWQARHRLIAIDPKRK